MNDRDARAQEQMNRAAENVNAWLAENEKVVCCDFCARQTDPVDGVTFVTSEPIIAELSGLTEELGAATMEMGWTPEWLACNGCAPVVRAGDPVKLTAHVLATRDVERVGPIPAEILDAVSADLIELYERFYELHPKEEACSG